MSTAKKLPVLLMVLATLAACATSADPQADIEVPADGWTRLDVNGDAMTLINHSPTRVYFYEADAGDEPRLFTLDPHGARSFPFPGQLSLLATTKNGEGARIELRLYGPGGIRETVTRERVEFTAVR